MVQRHQSVLCLSVFFLSILVFSWLEYLSGSSPIELPGSEGFSLAAAYGLAGIIGTAGSITGLFWISYRKWLWRFDKLVKIPVLGSKYVGAIEYGDVVGNSIRRHVDILISQELDSVRMRLVTNSMDSSTLIGRFMMEGDEPILYYVYRVDSRVLGIAKGSRYGAARLRLDLNGNLEGNYWTDENRRGRIWFADSAVANAAANTQENESACSAEELTVRFKDALVALSESADDNFSGLGIVVHDDLLDYAHVVSLRGEFEIAPALNLFTEQGRDRLLKAAAKQHGGHDGFCLAVANGTVDRVSQFLVPPVSPSLRPDSRRGARSYSALAFSTLPGVLVTGIVSEDGSVAVYSGGKRVYDSKDGETL